MGHGAFCAGMGAREMEICAFPRKKSQSWGTGLLCGHGRAGDGDLGFPTLRQKRGEGWGTGLIALCGLVQCEVGVERGVFAAVAYVDYELAGVDGPLLLGVVPVAEGAGV